MIILRTVKNFSSLNIAASILLFLMAILAAVIANSPMAPLYQGFLTDKYLHGVPEDSRLAKGGAPWLEGQLDDIMLKRLNALNEIALSRGQKLSQMALSWVLHNKAVATVLIGASRPSQIVENAECINKLDFTDEEISAIEAVLK